MHKGCCTSINNVGRTLLHVLGLPQKENSRPIGYITLNGRQGPGKVRNQRVAKLRIVLIIIPILIKSLFHNSSFMDIDTAI